jgi:hypothetical protein
MSSASLRMPLLTFSVKFWCSVIDAEHDAAAQRVAGESFLPRAMSLPAGKEFLSVWIISSAGRKLTCTLVVRVALARRLLAIRAFSVAATATAVVKR